VRFYFFPAATAPERDRFYATNADAAVAELARVNRRPPSFAAATREQMV